MGGGMNNLGVLVGGASDAIERRRRQDVAEQIAREELQWKRDDRAWQREMRQHERDQWARQDQLDQMAKEAANRRIAKEDIEMFGTQRDMNITPATQAKIKTGIESMLVPFVAASVPGLAGASIVSATKSPVETAVSEISESIRETPGHLIDPASGRTYLDPLKQRLMEQKQAGDIQMALRKAELDTTRDIAKINAQADVRRQLGAEGWYRNYAGAPSVGGGGRSSGGGRGRGGSDGSLGGDADDLGGSFAEDIYGNPIDRSEWSKLVPKWYAARERELKNFDKNDPDRVAKASAAATQALKIDPESPTSKSRFDNQNAAQVAAWDAAVRRRMDDLGKAFDSGHVAKKDGSGTYSAIDRPTEAELRKIAESQVGSRPPLQPTSDIERDQAASLERKIDAYTAARRGVAPMAAQSALNEPIRAFDPGLMQLSLSPKVLALPNMPAPAPKQTEVVEGDPLYMVDDDQLAMAVIPELQQVMAVNGRKMAESDAYDVVKLIRGPAKGDRRAAISMFLKAKGIGQMSPDQPPLPAINIR